jgi:hypothetical protein
MSTITTGRIKPSIAKPASPASKKAEPQRGFWAGLISYMGIEGDNAEMINEGTKRYQFRQVHPLSSFHLVAVKI